MLVFHYFCYWNSDDVKGLCLAHYEVRWFHRGLQETFCFLFVLHYYNIIIFLEEEVLKFVMTEDSCNYSLWIILLSISLWEIAVKHGFFV